MSEEKAVKKVCGHVNMHSIGVDKKLDKMSCDLKPGHDGDHSGVHEELQRTEETEYVNGEEITRVKYFPVERRCAWSDMAGTPVSEMPKPDPVRPPTMLELQGRIEQLEREGKWEPGKKLSEIARA